MSGFCFYAADAKELAESAGIKEKIEEFANSNKKQTYVLCRPLAKDDSVYDYEQAVAIFVSGMKPYFIDLGEDSDGFDEYCDDFIEDIAFLSEKFKYREKIGRKKIWGSLFAKDKLEKLDFDKIVVDSISDGRVVDLIISLVVGSVNDITRINLDARDLLDIIKSKIILFDTDQTSFVFNSGGSKKFVIQGLAGSGKTELLLHKMKEIYSRDQEARIAFTCYNKILASSMKSRIPDFFDFMRVERQIYWNTKLFCFHSWGSGKEPQSGMYRYICHSYGIPFGTLSSGPFDDLCKRALTEIKKISGDRKFIFDYVFIDESQDFGSGFIELCEWVTSKKVFVAGDVFQNIFRPIGDGVNRADMVLKKCYRTDPKNLMFSHALGMGLFEKPVLRWLKPLEWEACGYVYAEANNRAKLSRDPLRRFEDIPPEFKSTLIKSISNNVSISDEIIKVVNDIIERHPTVKQGDIAVIFLDKDSYIYDVIAELRLKITQLKNWSVNVSFETKTREPDKFFISNINNAKGLEFPFVICFAKDLRGRPSFRNALYTMMTRSFLESHLMIGNGVNDPIVKSISSGLDFMLQHGYMDVRVPTQDEIQSQQEFIVVDEQVSIDDYIRQFCKARSASPRLVAKLVSRIKSFIGDSDYNQDYLDELLRIEYERHKSL